MGFLKDIFGSKVKVPKFKEIDPDAEIDKAFRSIQQRMPEGKRVARSIAEADAETALAVLEQIAPGTRENIKLQTENIQAGLRGELPEDVQRFIIDRSVAQARQGGYGGSQAATFGELRNLGLTSLQRADVAMNQSAQMLASMRSLMPQQQSVANMFLTPGQRIDFVRSERDAKLRRDMAAAQAKAAPDPVVKGLASVGAKVAGSAIGAAIGGPAGAQMGSQMGGSIFDGGTPPYQPQYSLPRGYAGPSLGYGSGGGTAQPGFFKRFLGNIGSSMMGG
jgi:hypothetical protein